MADNGHTDDLGARVGVQSQRIANLEGLFADLRRDMNQQIGNVSTAISSITSKMDERFASMASSMADRNKPNFQAIGVALTFAVIIGGMAYWPIRESTTDLKATVATLAAETNQSIRMMAERSVSREELDWRAARGGEDRTRMEKAIDEIRTVMLPRAEWSERNLSRDHEVANLRESQIAADQNLQRQLDVQRADFQSFSSSLGNGRDFIQDIKSEVARLRDQLAEMRARQWQRFGAQQPAPP